MPKYIDLADSDRISKPISAFTIVELLIVIVVVGVLVTVSLVAYNGVQAKARTSVVNSELSENRKKLLMFNSNNGRYPTSAADLTAANLVISRVDNYDMRSGYSNFYYCSTLAGTTFSLSARAGDGAGSSYYVTSEEGLTPRTGLISQSSTCSLIGLTGTTSAEGAFASWGMTGTGVVSSWLRVGN